MNKVLGKRFLWSGISFSIAKNNLFYQAMWYVDDGPIYKGAFYDVLRGANFQEEKVDINTILEEFREFVGTH